MSRPLAIASRLVVSLGVFLAGGLAARGVRANGAFPQSFQLMLPADRASQIVLATNFGMIISDDAGASWTWTCEQKQTSMASLYAMSAPPLDRFFALSTFVGLASSDDQSCSWSSSGGTLAAVLASDYFPDPTNDLHVLAIGAPPDNSMPPQVFPSSDGGKTFTDAIFTAPAGATLSGVEIARSDRQTIYLAMATATHPMLVRSTNGGSSWTSLDVQPFLGPNLFRIIAVDPTDPQTISLRVIAAESESVAISHDGGQTFTTPVTLKCGQLTAYARLDSGTILVAGAVVDQAVGFRSTDGGKTFTSWVPHTLGFDAGTAPAAADAGAADASDAAGAADASDAADARDAADGSDAADAADAAGVVSSCDTAGATAPEVPGVPHLQALAVRAGKLYGAAKNYSDDWAVGVSTDEGLTFAPVMKYSDVKAIRSCAQKACLDSCKFQAGQFIWDVGICAAPKPTSGGGCGLAAPSPSLAAAALLLVALCVARGRRPRR